MDLNKEPWEQWYSNNLVEKTSQYVTMAMMSKKRVQAFSVNDEGKVNDVPVLLNPKGYEPTKKRPEELSIWQRIANTFSKLFRKQRTATMSAAFKYDDKILDVEYRVRARAKQYAERGKGGANNAPKSNAKTQPVESEIITKAEPSGGMII